ncbi:474_t:CDS:2 [Dentiscutata heterogama]|uniref:474_t:CDS:1 n=1 Tax=Dentiscutata heterogama TaxID=1316150 RepID=A0ACA9M2V7_9GLOM|nr:474_t:CDS:2 [Dentiscutata heterogama]
MSSIDQEKNDFKLKSSTIDQMFAPECFNIIFRYLPSNKDLYSCILVNRYWANCAIPILWESPFKTNNKSKQFPEVIQIYLTFIPIEKNFHNESLINKPLYDYPSFLKELHFNRFFNSAIANNCSEALIIKLFKMFSMYPVKLRQLDLSRLYHSFHNPMIYDVFQNLGYSTYSYVILLQHLEHSSMFSRLSYLNCAYHWYVEKTQIFNALANICRNIRNLKATVWCKNEGVALANLIRSQRCLKEFSLINSNHFISFPVQSLKSQIESLNSLTFKNMNRNFNFLNSNLVSTTLQLNDEDIFSLIQSTKIIELKFKNCEGLNLLPTISNFTNLTSLEYTYGSYNIYDNETPIEILSNLVKMNGKTLENIVFDWHSHGLLECTQLIKNVAESTINLKYLKTPIYTLEQLTLILQTQNQLKKLEIRIGNQINPHYALFLFTNTPFNNLKNSIVQLYFDSYMNLRLKKINTRNS